MRFNSTQELYDYIHSGKDLYDIDAEVYLFDYNWVGAIAYYYLDHEELIELAQEAQECGDYIGGCLGTGGYIVDVQLRAPDGEIIDYDDPGFDEHIDDEGYILDYSDIMDFLEGFINDRFISAMPDDLLGKLPNTYEPGTVGDYLYNHDEIEWVDIYYADSEARSWSCTPYTLLHDDSIDNAVVNAQIVRIEPGTASWVDNSVKIYI